MLKEVDYLIIGAGLYGLYSAAKLAPKGKKIVVLEYDDDSFSRATFINQARVHNGYHYPRSYSTAIKSAKYFDRFNKDFGFAINNKFKKVYATSKEYSLTNREQFIKFCEYSNVPCEELNPSKYFKTGLVDGCYLTEEYAYDAMIIKKFYMEKLKEFSNVELVFGSRIQSIEKKTKTYKVATQDHDYESPFVLNATYASTNQLNAMAGYEKFKIKYEICEIILCKTTSNIEDVGITVMDGPFFSVMPFGLTGDHSLTSVTFTPHKTSYDLLPKFECMEGLSSCSPSQLGNCNTCPNKPASAWNYMYTLAKKYLNDDIDLHHTGSLFSMKPILQASELDDSRPTVIRVFSESPTYISVLSGKINTVYDLDEVLL